MRDELDVALACCVLRPSLPSLYSIEPFSREGTKKRSRNTKLGQRQCHTLGRWELIVATESRVMTTQKQQQERSMVSRGFVSRWFGRPQDGTSNRAAKQSCNCG